MICGLEFDSPQNLIKKKLWEIFKVKKNVKTFLVQKGVRKKYLQRDVARQKSFSSYTWPLTFDGYT